MIWRISLFLLILSADARAFDAATTHAGLTENAAFASRLGQLLVTAYGRPLGLFDPLRWKGEGERGLRIASRLGKLDQAQGYAPHGDRATALAWITAGAVAEEVPGERDRHHFYDPIRKHGLEQGGYLAGFGVRIAGIRDGSGSLRGLFTGASFDGTGLAAVDWLTSERNDFSMLQHLDARERATAAATPAEREHALAEMLLTAGALLHVIEDAGHPAHVRNDWRVSMAERGDPLARLIADRYGRVALPAPAAAPPAFERFADALRALAERTNRRFFSEGTLPDSVPTAPGTATPFALPKTPVTGPAARGYAPGDGFAHLAAWSRDGRGAIHWDLDARVLADYAAATLPDTAATARAALDHLLRGSLAIEKGAVVNGDLPLGAGRLRIFTDDDKGHRREVSARMVSSAEAGATIGDLPAEGLGRRVAALFRGVDSHGEPIVIATEFTIESK
jgi:hypothetical protein